MLLKKKKKSDDTLQHQDQNLSVFRVFLGLLPEVVWSVGDEINRVKKTEVSAHWKNYSKVHHYSDCFKHFHCHEQ